MKDLDKVATLGWAIIHIKIRKIYILNNHPQALILETFIDFVKQQIEPEESEESGNSFEQLTPT